MYLLFLSSLDSVEAGIDELLPIEALVAFPGEVHCGFP